MRLKLESQYIQGICILCNSNKQTLKHTDKETNKKIFRNCCKPCLNKRLGKPNSGKKISLKYRKDTCEECGFIPVNKCQLDVDHIDGNKNNNNPLNFKTLCANCHRLKTFLNKDWKIKYK